MDSSPCCPPDSEPFLANTYATVGSIQQISDGVEFYETGEATSGKAIIIIPDIWGWNSGRTRPIADLLAQKGYYVVVPKLLVPPFQGGTDGDGFPAEFDWAEFKPYLAGLTWESSFKPRFVSLFAKLESIGIQKIGMIGFCWGGWVLCQVAADFPEKINAGVIAHPSITLEENIYGGSPVSLVSRVFCPVFLMPAGGDPDTYRPGGEILETLKRNNPASDILDFPDMAHGFVPRGDITDGAVHAAVHLAITKIQFFLESNL